MNQGSSLAILTATPVRACHRQEHSPGRQQAVCDSTIVAGQSREQDRQVSTGRRTCRARYLAV